VVFRRDKESRRTDRTPAHGRATLWRAPRHDVWAGPLAKQDCEAQGCRRGRSEAGLPERRGRSRAFDSPVPGEGRSPNGPAIEEARRFQALLHAERRIRRRRPRLLLLGERFRSWKRVRRADGVRRDSFCLATYRSDRSTRALWGSAFAGYAAGNSRGRPCFHVSASDAFWGMGD